MKTQILQPLRGWLPAGTALALAFGASATCLQAGESMPLPVTKDKVQAFTGVLKGGSLFTPGGGGRTSQAGDHAVDFGRGTGPVHVEDGAFLNQASQNDEMAFAFWIKNSDIAGNSAFWAYSPSSSSGGRGFQAHVPWSNNNIYFDTAGCCDAATQRINGNVADFPGYSGDVTWWTDQWHFLVFSKKADLKQVWIDGALFLEGSNTAPLPTDFTQLFIGAEREATSLVHGLMDDFSVFGTALSEAKIIQLFGGTLPTALPASDKLLAYWDFNDYPGEGQFVSFLPAPDAAYAAPNLIQVVHLDGATPWADANISLKVDGASVTPVLTRDGDRVTLRYVPGTLLAVQVKHRAALTYPGAGGTPQTVEWEFTVAPYTRDVLAARVGVFVGRSGYSQDAGGRSAKPGDYAVDFGKGTGPVHVPDGTFLNEAAAGDEMSFALWIKEYDNANNSAFYAVSPSSSGTQRGWQAHVPNGNNIYFDTAGCCDAGTQRINASITTFPGYSGEVTWWNDWHHFVFSKKADVKQVWIDGALFLEGSNTAPLPTDFTELFIGSDLARGSLVHGLVDDFAVFRTALTEAQINALVAGSLPTDLPASTQLLSYWNFNDIPSGGLFLSFSPTPDSTGAAPNLIKVVHQQGSALWDLAKVSLKVDDAPVTASVVRDGNLVTVRYVPNPVLAPLSAHTATLTYPLPDGSLTTRTWQFTVGMYTRDVLHQYVGVLRTTAQFTADGGGHGGQPGDYGIDFGQVNAGQAVHIPDATFLNEASANDTMAIAGWQKLYAVANSSFFWGVSPTAGSGNRGFQVHTPWSNNNIYFDTAGCCDGAAQRINASITTFPGYSGDATWWQQWHHLVIQKQATTKEVWIDGQLFLTGENSGTLPTDFTEAWLGFDPPDNAGLLGIIDDVAAFKTALSESDIVKLATGTLPNALPASVGLLAYWNFNDAMVPPPTLGIARDGANVTVTYGGTLQSADVVTGPWTDVVGATSPATIPATGAGKFYRARQ